PQGGHIFFFIIIFFFSISFHSFLETRDEKERDQTLSSSKRAPFCLSFRDKTLSW
uniref:Uncharacterized protein n=1 Tax=Labrus bergylta TaxID=56723 RepID=A0A3Q3NBU2_9LABR